MTARIAHLSELHFGREDTPVVEALLDDLAALRPTVVAVSGDLTQRARPAQFRAARAFLDRITTRIVELDRGILRSYPGNFAAYEERKEQEIAAEDVARRRFEKFWAQEEVWIRKGVEARRTRNEGRVKRL